MVFLDLKRACDTADHNILANKLTSMIVHPDSLPWFRNYLSNRQQKVMVNGKFSEQRLVKCGVPQGSILRPLLFIIYIIDLGKYLSECRVNLSAKDTTLFTLANSHIELS